MGRRIRQGESASQRVQRITFQDGLCNSLGAFLLLMIIFLLLVNPKARFTEEPIPPPGNIIVEAYWSKIDSVTNKPIDTDVDLHVKCGEEPPISYSNKGNRRCNYLRDDLGSTYDPSDPVNYEFTVSRGLVAGRYCVNVHEYSNRWGQWPIDVQVTVKINKGTAGSGKSEITKVLDKTVQLTQVGQEINLFCFFVDEKGEYESDKTFQSDAICLRSPVDNATGKCAVVSGSPF